MPPAVTRSFKDCELQELGNLLNTLCIILQNSGVLPGGIFVLQEEMTLLWWFWIVMTNGFYACPRPVGARGLFCFKLKQFALGSFNKRVKFLLWQH